MLYHYIIILYTIILYYIIYIIIIYYIILLYFSILSTLVEIYYLFIKYYIYSTKKVFINESVCQRLTLFDYSNFVKTKYNCVKCLFVFLSIF